MLKRDPWHVCEQRRRRVFWRLSHAHVHRLTSWTDVPLALPISIAWSLGSLPVTTYSWSARLLVISFLFLSKIPLETRYRSSRFVVERGTPDLGLSLNRSCLLKPRRYLKIPGGLTLSMFAIWRSNIPLSTPPPPPMDIALISRVRWGRGVIFKTFEILLNIRNEKHRTLSTSFFLYWQTG